MTVQARYAAPAAIVLIIAAAIQLAGGTGLFIFYGAPMLFGVAAATIDGRRAPRRTYWGHLITAFRYYFAVHLIWSSYRYWFTPMQPVVPGPIGGPFIASLEAMGTFPIIKTLEGVVGLALLVNRFVPLALMIEVPISANIFWLNAVIVRTAHTSISGPAELAVNGLLLLAYLPQFRTALVATAEPFPPRWPAPASGGADAPASDRLSH